MTALVSTEPLKQINLNLLLSVLLLVAIYSESASSSRLLPENQDVSIPHVTASPAAIDLQGPKLHSGVARSHSPRDGIGNAFDANDVARPGGLNTINAESAEISPEGNDIHRRIRRSSWSPYYNDNYNNIAEEPVFNAYPKGPSHKGHAVLFTERRLSASKPSGVARMQVGHGRAINTMLRSKHKHGSRHVHESRQRILKSSPSPGDGN